MGIKLKKSAGATQTNNDVSSTQAPMPHAKKPAKASGGKNGVAITTKIFCILSFLAAIAAIVMSVMLFNKREELTLKQKKMAEAITAATNKIDPAVKMKWESMDVKKTPDEITAPLNKFSSTVTKIYDQRDKIAKALADVSDTVVKPEVGLDPKSVTEYATTDSTIDAVKEGAKNRIFFYDDRNEKLAAMMKEYSAIYDMPVDGDVAISSYMTSENDSMADAFKRLNDRSTFVLGKAKSFVSHVSNASATMELETPAVDDETFRVGLKGNMENVKYYVADYKKTKADNARLTEQLKVSEKSRLTTEENFKILSEGKDKTDKELKAARAEIDRLKKIIDPEYVSESQLISIANDKNFDFSLFKELKGRITYVDTRYNFVAIDLGKNSKLEKMIDGKTTIIPIPMPADAEMTIASSLDSETGAYAGKIRIVRVSDDASVGEILAFPKGKVEPKVGDVVFFAETDLAKMKAKRDVEVRKAMTEKAKRDKAEKIDLFVEGSGTAAEPAAEEQKDAPASEEPAAEPSAEPAAEPAAEETASEETSSDESSADENAAEEEASEADFEEE